MGGVLVALIGLGCGHPRQTECTLHFALFIYLVVRVKENEPAHALKGLLAPLCPMCAHPTNQYSFTRYSQSDRNFPGFFERRFKRKSCCVHLNKIKIDGVSLGC